MGPADKKMLLLSKSPETITGLVINRDENISHCTEGGADAVRAIKDLLPPN